MLSVLYRRCSTLVTENGRGLCCEADPGGWENHNIKKAKAKGLGASGLQGFGARVHYEIETSGLRHPVGCRFRDPMLRAGDRGLGGGKARAAADSRRVLATTLGTTGVTIVAHVDTHWYYNSEY